MQWIFLAAAAAALSQANPIADPTQDLAPRTAGAQLATFDDLTANSAVPVPYKGLNFESVTVADDEGGRLTIAQSQPYYVEASAQQYLNVSIEGTNTTSFDLESYYIGCFDTRSRIATDCQLTVTGRTGPGSRDRYGPILYQYTPVGDGANSPMLRIDPSWGGLKYFYISVYEDDAKLMRTYVTLDNVEYTTYE